MQLIAASVIRGGRPEEVRQRPSRPRAWSAFDQGTCCSSNSLASRPGARSSPSVETIRPSFIGYSVDGAGRRAAARAGTTALRGRRPASTVAWAIARASAAIAPQRRDLGPPERREKPPTRTETGWIARPPMELDDPVAGLLEARPSLDGRPMVPGHVQGARVAEEVGQVEQVDVERVALDPLAAVEQPAERPRSPDRPRSRAPCSNAWTAVIWYATGQMPQMRATMSMTSSGVRPTTSCSK